MTIPLKSRILGAVLGAAIGDAMGHPTEFLSMQQILHTYPPAGVQKFELFWGGDSERFAPYTDDTQLAEIVLTTLVEGREAGWTMDETMTSMAPRIANWRVNPLGGHRAPGNSCMAGAKRLAEGVHWSEGGGPMDGGCGSVMRAYPFGVLFCDAPSTAIEWAWQHSKLTHRAPIAFAACAAMAAAMAHLANGRDMGAAIEAMIQAANPFDAGTARLIAEARGRADNGEHPHDVLARYQGWAAHEAVAAAAFVVRRHPNDPAAAILEGANSDGDSDSIATLAGAMLGVRCGIEALPEDWVRDVERSEELQALALRAAAAIGR